MNISKAGSGGAMMLQVHVCALKTRVQGTSSTPERGYYNPQSVNVSVLRFLQGNILLLELWQRSLSLKKKVEQTIQQSVGQAIIFARTGIISQLYYIIIITTRSEDNSLQITMYLYYLIFTFVQLSQFTKCYVIFRIPF